MNRERERERHFVRFLRETTIGPTSVRVRWRTGKLLFLLCRSSFCASRLHAYIAYTVFSSREETPRYDRINITGANSRSERPRIVRSFVTSRRVEIPRPAQFSRSRGCRWKFVPPITQLLEWPTFRTRGVRFTIVFTRLKKLASRRYDASRACLAATEHRGTIVLGRQLRRNRFNVALFNDPENRDGNAVPHRRFYRPRYAVISIAR